MTNLVGQQLGNYRLIRLLGEGGFAEVYLGEHIHLGTQAAIKVLHTQIASDDIEKFRTEARTVAHLIHPHIVRVLDFGVEGKTPYLVMDYAPKGTLRQRYPRGTKVPLVAIVSYVKQVSDALQYAHNEKLIHRDIKPENMLVGRQDEVLLSDFGIALIAQSSRYQNTQEIAGTVAYMAPEQIQGKPRPASDQYSLAVVVYEWLCKERPFQGSFTEIATQHVVAPPPPLHEKDPTIPPDVERVIMTALAKDPKERFGSIEIFADELDIASQPGEKANSTPTIIASSLNIPSSAKPIRMPPQPVSSRNSLQNISTSRTRDRLISVSDAPNSSATTPPSKFKRYLIGAVLFLVIGDITSVSEKALVGKSDKLLFNIASLPIYISTLLFLVTLIILLIVLARLDLLPLANPFKRRRS
jgi:serine/threonine protein kinase